MTRNPLQIISQQLELLAERSAKGLLTPDETKQLSELIKLQLILRTRPASDADSADDDLADLSSEELRQLLPLLS